MDHTRTDVCDIYVHNTRIVFIRQIYLLYYGVLSHGMLLHDPCIPKESHLLNFVLQGQQKGSHIRGIIWSMGFCYNVHFTSICFIFLFLLSCQFEPMGYCDHQQRNVCPSIRHSICLSVHPSIFSTNALSHQILWRLSMQYLIKV